VREEWLLNSHPWMPPLMDRAPISSDTRPVGRMVARARLVALRQRFDRSSLGVLS